MYNTIKVEIQDNLLILSLNRPEKRNAINDETILAIEEVFSNIPKSVVPLINAMVAPHY